MTALPAPPGTAVKLYHPASLAALARGGTGSDRPSMPAGPPGPPGPLSVMRSAARPTDGAETVHGPADRGAFLARGRVLGRLVPGGFRMSRRSRSCRISRLAATRCGCDECA